MKTTQSTAATVHRKRPRKSLTLSKTGLEILRELSKQYSSESRVIDAALAALQEKLNPPERKEASL